MPAVISVAKRRGKSKVKISEKRKHVETMLEKLNVEDLNTTAAFIQELIPLGLKAFKEQAAKEVEKLTGKRYEHDQENFRWGKQGGSVYLRDQKIPINVPRIRSRYNTEVPLEIYQKLQKPYKADEQTILKLLNGISMRRYSKCAELVPEVFGLSASNLSKRFRRGTAEKIQRLKSRSLALYDIACIFIDGKRYAKDGLLVVLGVTMRGQKVILDIDHSHTENALVVDQLFDRLFERGLKYEEGLLFIVDGSKGLINGIKNKFKEYAFIQRCQWHKRENVLSYLDKGQKQSYRRRLQDAYKQTTYNEAKKELSKIYYDLSETNQSAANSLVEGLEETLTLHKLGLSAELRRSFSTTNCIESVMSQLAQYTDKVDRWRNSYQLLRWTAASLLEIEPCLRKTIRNNCLNALRFKMKEEIKKRKEKKYGRLKKEGFLEPLMV